MIPYVIVPHRMCKHVHDLPLPLQRNSISRQWKTCRHLKQIHHSQAVVPPAPIRWSIGRGRGSGGGDGRGRGSEEVLDVAVAACGGCRGGGSDGIGDDRALFQ